MMGSSLGTNGQRKLIAIPTSVFFGFLNPTWFDNKKHKEIQNEITKCTSFERR